MEYKITVIHPFKTVESDWIWYNEDDAVDVRLGQLLKTDVGYFTFPDTEGKTFFVPVEYLRQGLLTLEFRDDPKS